jgi:imidazolonepropionase-like amidohydrolase
VLIMKIISIIAVAALLGMNPAGASDQIPAPGQSRVLALRGATIYPVSSTPIRAGTIVLSGGKITMLGTGVAVPDDAEVIDVSGKRIYPGLINAYTSIGLTEIGSVRGTRDTREVGRINPNVRAEVSVNPGSEIIPVTRANGITAALSVPTGGIISGRSAMLMLDGWTWEDMVLKGSVGLHVTWPRMTIVHAWWMDDSEEKQRENRQESLDVLFGAFRDARAYMKARASNGQRSTPRHPTDLRWEAMIPVFKKEMPVIVTANGVRQIQAAVAWAKTDDLRLVLVGGADAWRVADLLKQRDIPVIVGGTHYTPLRRWEDYDSPFTLPLKLHEAGIRYCISSTIGFSGSGDASDTRNVPYEAATAAAYGLPQDEALKAITLYPAQILGVDDRVGSLEVGKDATLIVTDGDPLETPTHVERMYIQGRNIDLTSRHTMLYGKYKTKYNQKR